MLYPVACSPQAWAAATVIMLLQSCLGLSIDASRSEVRFARTTLPPSLNEVHIKNLQVGAASLDLAVESSDDKIKVDVSRQEGQAEIVIA